MALTRETIALCVDAMRRAAIPPHPDGTYDCYLAPGHAQAAFDAGFAPFCPLITSGVALAARRNIAVPVGPGYAEEEA